jgi:signal transduction histidine kinase
MMGNYQSIKPHSGVKAVSSKTPIEESRDLAAYINEVLEEERARIAREMHDELGQQLTALKMDLDDLQRSIASSSDPNKAKLTNAIIFVDEIIDTVRRISLELRPSILDDLGLLAAMEWQCDVFQKKNNIPCSCFQQVKRTDFEKGLTNTAFRILQEILTNVSRHAQATKVEVSIIEIEESLIIEVIDNGRGISETSLNKNSLGILGMKERARLIGGEVCISAREEKGTRVKASLPLKPDK